MTATCILDCSLFILKRKEVDKIRENFMDVYREMQEKAINKFKFHQYLISKELKAFVERAKGIDESDNEELYNPVREGEDEDSDGLSITSDNMDEKFEK